MHVEQNHRELKDWRRGETFDEGLRGETHPTEDIRNVTQKTDGAARCLQLRGEYMYVAEGKGGFRVYDVASIANKDVSREDPHRAVLAARPEHPCGLEERDLHGAADQPADRARCATPPRCAQANQEQPFHPIYNYAVVTDSRGRPDPGQRRHAAPTAIRATTS